MVDAGKTSLILHCHESLEVCPKLHICAVLISNEQDRTGEEQGKASGRDDKIMGGKN